MGSTDRQAGLDSADESDAPAYGGVVAVPVYVIHWNAPEWCVATVESFEASTVPVDVTVIDNSSSYRGPGTIERPGSNVGFAGAANIALRTAATKGATWCVIACHDAIAAPNAVQHLLAARRPPYAILGAVLDGAIPAWVRSDEEDGVVPANTIIGTLMLLNVETALFVGGFDERYGSYFEEVDLCHRVWIAGYRVGFVTGANVWTKGSSSPSADALRFGNHVLLTLKEEGRLAAIREVGQLGRDAVASALRSVITPPRSVHRASAKTMAHAFTLASLKVARYWRLASVQEHHGVMPE